MKYLVCRLDFNEYYQKLENSQVFNDQNRRRGDGFEDDYGDEDEDDDENDNDNDEDDEEDYGDEDDDDNEGDNMNSGR